MKLSLDVEKFKTAFPQAKPSEGLNQKDVQKFLREFYKKPLDRNTPDAPQTKKQTTPNSGEDPAIFREQAIKMCREMHELGFANFADLRKKFPKDMKKEQIDTTLRETKATMEAILYAFKHHPSMSMQELAAQYRDRPFLCGPGTLTNLQQILADVTLSGQSVDHYFADAKHEVLEQTAKNITTELEKHIEGVGLWEVHITTSLINQVAREFKLEEKPLEEDKFLLDLPKAVGKKFLAEVKKTFAQEDLPATMLASMAGKILNDLPRFGSEKPNEFYDNVSEALEKLNILPNAHSILIEYEDYGTPKRYKPHAEEIIQHALVLYLNEKGMIPDAQVELSKAVIEMEKTMVSMEGKTNVIDPSLFDVTDSMKDPAQKKMAESYAIKHGTLDEDYKKELIEHTPPERRDFVKNYARYHNDKGLFDAVKTQEAKEKPTEKTKKGTQAQAAKTEADPPKKKTKKKRNTPAKTEADPPKRKTKKEEKTEKSTPPAPQPAPVQQEEKITAKPTKLSIIDMLINFFRGLVGFPPKKVEQEASTPPEPKAETSSKGNYKNVKGLGQKLEQGKVGKHAEQARAGKSKDSTGKTH